MEAVATSNLIEPKVRLALDDAVEIWREVESLEGVPRVSLRRDRAGFTEARAWEMDEGESYFEVVVYGDVDGPTLSMIQAVAASRGRIAELADNALKIR